MAASVFPERTRPYLLKYDPRNCLDVGKFGRLTSVTKILEVQNPIQGAIRTTIEPTVSAYLLTR